MGLEARREAAPLKTRVLARRLARTLGRRFARRLERALWRSLRGSRWPLLWPLRRRRLVRSEGGPPGPSRGPRRLQGHSKRALARASRKGPLQRALARLLVDMPRPGAQGRALCEAGAAAPSPGVHRHRSHSLDGMHPIRTGSHAAARGPLTTRKTRRGARIGSKTMAAKKDRHDDRARRGDLDYGLRFWRLNYSGSRRRAVWKNAEDRLQGQRARPSRGHSWGRLETVPSNARKTSLEGRLEDRLKGRLDDGSSF